MVAYEIAISQSSTDTFATYVVVSIAAWCQTREARFLLRGETVRTTVEVQAEELKDARVAITTGVRPIGNQQPRHRTASPDKATEADTSLDPNHATDRPFVMTQTTKVPRVSTKICRQRSIHVH